jgi:hypothetical protein
MDVSTKRDDAQRKGKRFKSRRQWEGSPALRAHTGIHALFIVEGGGGLVWDLQDGDGVSFRQNLLAQTRGRASWPSRGNGSGAIGRKGTHE